MGSNGISTKDYVQNYSVVMMNKTIKTYFKPSVVLMGFDVHRN